MRSYLLNIWQTIRSSYWFIPAIMSFGSILLSLASIEFDARVGSDVPSQLDWLFNNQPDGARAVLSTIAGSMITVAGVVFSITLVTLSTAASQYGPRLLTNFMRDQTNQVALGTFISTFLYCLFVLRAVQDAPVGSSDAEAAQFVPHVALLIGIGFAVSSIAVLIRFIHHVPQSIHISLVTSKIGETLCARMSERYPKGTGTTDSKSTQSSASDLALAPSDFSVPIRAQKAGYIRVIDTQTLMEFAEENSGLFKLEKQPGDYVLPGEPLLFAPKDFKMPEDLEDDLRAAVSIGKSRTPAQDTRFLIQELVEIGARALSPGVNDPVTAIACLNWLAAAMIKLSEQEQLDPIRRDADGVPRLLVHILSFEDLLKDGFGRLTPYVAADTNAASAAIDLLSRIKDNVPTRFHGALKSEAEALRNALNDCLQPSLREKLTQAIDDTFLSIN